MKRFLLCITYVLFASCALAGYGTEGANGYGGNLYPPQAGLTQWLKTGTTDGLTVVDSKGGASAKITGVSCLEFDGSAGSLDSGVTVTGGQSFDFTWKGYVDRTGSYNIFGSCGGYSALIKGIMIRENNADLLIATSDGTAPLSLLYNDIFTADGEYELHIVWDGTSTTPVVTLNGAPQTPTSGTIAGWTGESSTTFRFGEYAGTIFGGGRLYDAEIAGLFHYACQEGSGLPQDVSGNGNHATANTATWVKDDSGELVSYLDKEGFTTAVVSDGTGQYIDTGIIPDDSTRATLTFTPTSFDSSVGLFGCRTGTGTDSFNVFLFSTSGDLRFDYGSDLGSQISPLTIGERVTISLENNKGYVNGTHVATITGGSLSNPLPIALMAVRTGGIYGLNSAGEFYRFQIWQDVLGVRTLVRDMIPYGEGQFLDKVNDVVYSNVGATGTLVTRRIPALAEPTKSVATFDGVGDYVALTNHIIGANKTFVGTLILPSATERITLFGGVSLFDGLAAVTYGSVGSTRFAVRSSSTTGAGWTQALSPQTLSPSYFDDEYHDVIFTIVGDVIDLYIDGNHVIDTFSTWNDGLPDPLAPISRIGWHTSGSLGDSYYTGNMTKASVIGDSGEVSYDFTDKLGKTTTDIEDLSGNGNNGTVVSDDLPAFWGKRYADYVTVRDTDYLTFDGVGDYVTCGNGFDLTASTNDFEITFEANLDGAVQFDNIVAKVVSGFFGYRIEKGAVDLRFNYVVGSGTYYVDFTPLTGMHKYVITRTGLQMSLTIDDAPATFTGDTLSGISEVYTAIVAPLEIGRRINNLYPAMSMQSFGITTPTNVLSYDFTDSEDYLTTTITDRSGNGNDGTLVPNATLTEIWGTSQQELDPAFVGTVVDASAYLELTNPPGYPYIGSGTSLVLADGSTNTFANLVSYTNNTGATHASCDPATGRMKNIIQYDTPQTNNVLNLYMEIMK